MNVSGLIFLAFSVFFFVTDSAFGFVGGKNAHEGQFPYQVSLRKKENNQHYCSGSILSSHFVLTSAYCVFEYHGRPQRIYLVVGALYRLEGGVDVDISKITIPRYFSRHTMREDIALLRTVQEIVFTNLIQPIPLPTQNLPEQNVAVHVAGWGLTKYPRTTFPLERPNILQYYETNTINNTKCAYRHGLPPGVVPNPLIEKSNVCTENSLYFGVCLGDGGGPLVDVTDSQNHTLAGIVSWEYTCALGRPDVFTRVYSYLDWIKTNIAK